MTQPIIESHLETFAVLRLVVTHKQSSQSYEISPQGMRASRVTGARIVMYLGTLQFDPAVLYSKRLLLFIFVLNNYFSFIKHTFLALQLSCH